MERGTRWNGAIRCGQSSLQRVASALVHAVMGNFEKSRLEVDRA